MIESNFRSVSLVYCFVCTCNSCVSESYKGNIFFIIRFKFTKSSDFRMILTELINLVHVIRIGMAVRNHT